MDDETSREILRAKVQPAAVRPGETSIDCITRIAVENEPELVGSAWYGDVRNLNFYGRHLYLIDGQFRSASEEDIIMSMPLVRMELDIAADELDKPTLQYVSIEAEGAPWEGAAFTDTTKAPPTVWHNPTNGPWLIANHGGYYSSGIELVCDAAEEASGQAWDYTNPFVAVYTGTSLAHPGQKNHQVITVSMASGVESVVALPTFMFRPDANDVIKHWRDIRTSVAFHFEWRVKGETVGHTYEVTLSFEIYKNKNTDKFECKYSDGQTDTYDFGWPWRKFTLTGLDAEQEYEFDEFLMRVTFDAEIEHWNKENHATIS